MFNARQCKNYAGTIPGTNAAIKTSPPQPQTKTIRINGSTPKPAVSCWTRGGADESSGGEAGGLHETESGGFIKRSVTARKSGGHHQRLTIEIREDAVPATAGDSKDQIQCWPHNDEDEILNEARKAKSHYRM